MRTSVDEDGRAREGLLFGIESLTAGQRFIARIDADDIRYLQPIERALSGRTVIMGRSKTAEYGEAFIEIVPNAAVVEPKLTGPGTVLFLCLSDLALIDPVTGNPRLQAMPSDFGLSATWRVDPSVSFVRFRRYSPFNTHRNRHDSDRQVIAAGSVFVFRNSAEAEPVLKDNLIAKIEAGIGQYVQDGLGQVAMEPALLREREVFFREHEVLPMWPAVAVTDELLTWLNNRAEKVALQDEAFLEVKKDAETFRR
jgi:hypothetical protein